MGNKLNENVEQIYSLTYMQEGMLYHKLLEDKSAEHIVQSVMKITGRLNVINIDYSLQLLSNRFEALRTLFLYRKVHKPRQAVLRQRKIETEVIDISGVLSHEREKKLHEIKKEDIERGFDLEKDSLMRVKVVRADTDIYYMVWSFHHIILDGWSLALVFETFMNYYAKLQKGLLKYELNAKINHIKSNTYKYQDYVQWLEKQDKNKGLRYWRDFLSNYGEPAVILSNQVSRRLPVESKAAEDVLDDRESELLLETASRENITISTIIETAWGILLQKYNGREDVVFGKVVSGRNANIKGIEKMVGLFINTIPTRVKTDNAYTCLDLLKIIQRQSIDSSEYEYCPLVDVQKESLLNNKLIGTLFAFENYYSKDGLENSVPDLKIQMESDREQTNYSLCLKASFDKSLVLTLLYDSSIYTEEELKLLLRRLKKIILTLIKEPNKKINEINLVEEGEKSVLDEFNNTDAAYSSSSSVHKIFEEQAERYPDSAALVFDGQSMTYEQLNTRSNQLAEKLSKFQIQADDFIVIDADKSIQTIIGILAILKSGGAYVPIDSNYPQERIDYIIKDCGAKVILTGERLLLNDTKTPILNLYDEKNYIGDGKDNSVSNGLQDLVYLMYTSGTTGVPKGVMIEHKSIIRLVKNASFFKFDSPRILQTGSLMFDASTFEIWGALLNGGTLYLERQESIFNIIKMKRIIEENKINIMFLTTSLYNQIVTLDTSVFDSLDNLVIGGEKASVSHIRLLKDYNNKIHIINGYGPTECTTFATAYEIEAVNERIPIGKPIANTNVFIMNHNCLCGIGMTGELCLGGDGLARGYLNQDAITKEKFVLNTDISEQRIYKTGDLARWLADGTIEFLGREDDQIKMRGFRIELNEIKNSILRDKKIGDAAVILNDNETQEKCLCAYITSKEIIHCEDLKQRLEKELPKYMVPSFFMQIESIPVNNNGKLDRKALPKIMQPCNSEFLTPESKTEKDVASIFQEIMGIEQISLDDNFFDLGGNSITAIKVITKAHEYQYELTITELLFNGSVRRLAKLIDEKREKKEEGEQTLESGFMQNNNCLAMDNITLRDLKKINQQMKELIKIYKAQFLGCQTEKEIPMAAIQLLSYDLGIRSSYAEIELGPDLHMERLEQVVKYVIRVNPMLRSTLKISSQRSIISEYQCPDKITIPVMDLSEVPKEAIPCYLNEIQINYRIYNEDHCYEGKDLSNFIVVVKVNQRSNKLFMGCSHLIFDGISQELFCNYINDMYCKKAEISHGSNKKYGYQDYVEQIKKGPAAPSLAEIADKLKLPQFCDAMHRLQKILEETEIELVNYECDLTHRTENIVKNDLLELSNTIYEKALEFIFKKEAIPVFIICMGRKLENMNFYQYIGEFIDIVPIMIGGSPDNGISQEAERIQKFLQNNNINVAEFFESSHSKEEFAYLGDVISKIKSGDYQFLMYNYIASYELKGNVTQPVSVSKEKLIETDVICRDHMLYMKLPCKKGQEELLIKYLNQYIK